MENNLAQHGSLEDLSQEQLDALVKLHNRFLDGRLGGRRASLKNIDLSGLSLQGQNLMQAEFLGCKMLGMNLANANFQEASLYACDLSNSNLKNTIFIRADLRGARIENAMLQGADLEKADLRIGGVAGEDGGYDSGQVVNFRGANLSGARLAGTVASNADFSDADMSGANMAGADLRGAQMEGANLTGADIGGSQLQGANFKSAILIDIEMDRLTAVGANIDDAITSDNVGQSVSDLEEPMVKLVESHKEWVKTAGAGGKQLDLSGVDMRVLATLKQQALTAVTAINTKFFGMNLYQIQLQSAVLDESDFRNCDMEEADLRGSSFVGANFGHAKMRGVNAGALMFGAGDATRRFSPCSFENAKLRYADMQGGHFKDANFKGADLSYADFTGADLRDADFDGANMDGVIFDGAQTEGANIPLSHKPVFKMKIREG